MTDEGKFKADLVEELRELFPEAIITYLDPTHIQGLPDIIILYGDRWATLEAKKSKTASHRPNQDYYVDLMNSMSYSSFIYPENREEIIYELQQSLRPRRKTRLSRR